jgi:uncharacterized protein (TIGR02246 family)
MRKAILVFVGVTLFATVAKLQTKPGTPADEAAILKNRDKQNAAFNAHDAKAYAAFAAVDVDRVDSVGTVSGRDGIEKYYANNWNADNSAMVKDESRKVRFVTSDVAILDVDNAVTRTNGTVKNHAAFIYVKRNGKWEMVAHA